MKAQRKQQFQAVNRPSAGLQEFLTHALPLLNNKWTWLFGIALVLAYVSYLQYSFSPAAPAASQPQPFALPTFDNKDKDFHVVELGAPPVVRYDFDAVFSKIEQCFPIRSYFSDSTDLTVTSNQISLVTNNQINPLYSIPFEGGSSERRLIILESELRLKIITLVSDFFQSIEQVQYNDRALHFYQSLEQRAKERVKRGIVSVDEQVTYLEKVIKTEHDLNEWRVKFDASRLSLTAFCKDSERGGLNQYLMGYVK